MTVMLRAMEPGDWPAVREIFQEGIDTGFATFESSAPEWDAFNNSRLPDHRFVAVNGEGNVLGWTAVSPVSKRPAYAGVVEHSIYVAGAARSQGVGALLLTALADSTEAKGIWTIQSSIFPENEASLRLHQANGFAIVGRRERIARLSTGPAAGQWRDTLLLERRSPVID
ncbi:phosphinothricin acetyltransferase [Paenarthrobacter nicotinovorans]|uniref:GNAT family N-acetyltransferase n=1 Tax=Micrococcaceae TaxID=1268 RepID=UPI000876A411|nr:MULTISPECIES: GNAT family N-acetyltransferase [Micrococcaceae]MDR6438633.1 phosphinothricin acetyltransferase [Paenarthrobacter nicotinovorans]SCZ59624.1 phosphinothricin acetyltransferase [Arthrobacter sp. UNCCL28]